MAFLLRSRFFHAAFAIFFILQSTPIALASLMELQAVSKEKLENELSYLAKWVKAVAVVKYLDKSSKQVVQSGFFIRPNFIMTALNVEHLTTKLNCANIVITAGDYIVASGQSKTYKCVKIVEENPKYGYAFIETDQASESFLDIVGIDSGFSFKDLPVYSVLGFSGHARLFVANHCTAIPNKCKSCAADGLGISWNDTDCLHFESMIGGPIISRGLGDPVITGILAAPTAPLDGTYVVEDTKMIRFEELFAVSSVMQQLNEPAPSCTLVANPPVIDNGQTTKLTISVVGKTTSKNINGVGDAQLEAGNSLTVAPKKDTTFKGLASNFGGAGICEVKVKVNYVAPPSCKLVASPAGIFMGDSSTLTVSTFGVYKTVQISDDQGNVVASTLSTSVKPLKNALYTAKVAGPGGETFCQANIYVNKPAVPTCTLTANPSSIKAGESSILTIQPKGSFTSLLIQDAAGVNLNINNATQVTVKPTVTSIYNGKISGYGGATYCQGTITITP